MSLTSTMAKVPELLLVGGLAYDLVKRFLEGPYSVAQRTSLQQNMCTQGSLHIIQFAIARRRERRLRPNILVAIDLRKTFDSLA